MQTGAFNPLNLLPALIPLNRNGVVSPQLYHQWYVCIHFLGACFMFALVRELKLSRFSALIAGICFSFGGFIIHAPWRHMYESAIWLPLVFLFLLRSLGSQTLKRALLYASAGGLMLGMTILAGGLHIAIMQILAVIAFAVFAIFHPQILAEKYRSRSLIVPLLACAMMLAVGFFAGALQLFPSMEYGGRALRWLGHNAPALSAKSQIPFAYLKDYLEPNAFLGMLIPTAIRGSGEIISPYIGVFPLLAAIIGIVKCWNSLWVRYFAGLAAVTFLYCLGERSLLYGVPYPIVPYLWMVRETSRFIYLANFALPVLVAFGIESLLYKPLQKSDWRGLNRVLLGVVIACAAALAVPAFFGRLEISAWVSLSILLILMSYGLFHYIIRGRTGTPSQVLVVALILFDLSAFNWLPRNKIDEANSGNVNHLERLMSCRGAVDFLKSKPAPYRAKIDVDPKPNIGHLFQIPTIHNTGVTALKDSNELAGHFSKLLNVRYIIKPSSAAEPGALYQDAAWKVYENPDTYPGAWIVHETTIEPSVEGFRQRMDAQSADLNQMAVVNAPLDVSLEARTAGMPESVTFGVYKANRLELDVQAHSRGLLVLNEIFYPGWRATVNGNRAKIYRVNGILRGVVVPKGRSRIVLQYTPVSVFAGAALSLIAFSGTLLGFALQRRK
jgi:hypothetical protein